MTHVRGMVSCYFYCTRDRLLRDIRFDCIPTTSLGSVWSLFRVIRSIDRLPLDVYERAAYVLDSHVRVQQREQGLEGEKTRGHRGTLTSAFFSSSSLLLCVHFVFFKEKYERIYIF